MAAGEDPATAVGVAPVALGNATKAERFVERVRLDLVRAAPEHDSLRPALPGELEDAGDERSANPATPGRGRDRQPQEFRLAAAGDRSPRRLPRPWRHQRDDPQHLPALALGDEHGRGRRDGTQLALVVWLLPAFVRVLPRIGLGPELGRRHRIRLPRLANPHEMAVLAGKKVEFDTVDTSGFGFQSRPEELPPLHALALRGWILPRSTMTQRRSTRR
jgi:hypothetical protein